jgi:D-alanyl-D-alanine carboxypeptidase (penicillin-binding protein 5/6)
MSSSAYDLALLFRTALREPLFAQTIATRSVDFPGYGTHPGFVLYNSSKLLARYPGAIGGKTGFTEAARHTLVGAAERDGRRLVVALVRGEQSPEPMWQQATALFDWGFELPPGRAAVGELVAATPLPAAAMAAAAATPGTASASAAMPMPEMLVPIGLCLVAVAALTIGGLALNRGRR